MAAKNPAKLIDFTDEVIARIPLSKRHTEFWWDRTHKYFGVRKVPNNPAPDFVVELGAEQRKALAKTGIKINRYLRLGRIPLEEARAHAIRIWQETRAGTIKKGSIPDGYRSVVPEAILKEKPPVDNPSYDLLMSALMDAYQQAAYGKGAERHGCGLNFEDQDMLAIMDRVGIGFALGQAIKKCTEGRRMDIDRARKEFLGAIVYIAGAVIWLDRQ